MKLLGGLVDRMGRENIRVEKISSNEQFEECMKVTREAWEDIPEIEQIPTHIMKASSRTGQFLIAFLDNKIAGYSMSFAQLPTTLYLHAIGVRRNYKSIGVGEAIMKKMKGEAINSGFTSINLTYAPLLGNNANLYIHKIGGTVDNYEEDAYCKTFNKSTGGEAPADRFLVNIDLHSSEKQRHNLKGIEDILKIRLNEINCSPENRIQITNLNIKIKNLLSFVLLGSFERGPYIEALSLFLPQDR